MPFGSRYAAQTFQRFSYQILRGFPFVFAYLDDLLVAASTSHEEHESHLHQICERLRDYGIVINIAKSVLGVDSVEFLAHLIRSQEISTLPYRVEAILQLVPS